MKGFRMVKRCLLLLCVYSSLTAGEIVVRKTASGVVIENAAVRRVIACSSMANVPNETSPPCVLRVPIVQDSNVQLRACYYARDTGGDLEWR